MRSDLGLSVDQNSVQYHIADKAAFILSVLAPTPGGKVKAVKEFYTIYYEMQLPKEFIVADRGIHFQEANRVLQNNINNDCSFAKMMSDSGVVVPYGKNEPLRKSPEGFVWHHSWYDADNKLDKIGKMQLVPAEQHSTRGGEYWKAMHPGPNLGGGYAQWGKK